MLQTNSPLRAVKDTLPPHDTAAEAGALACVLLADGDAAAAMLDKLDVDSFYDVRHQVIYRTLAALRRANAELDVVALTQRLRDKGNMEDAGGAEYVTALPDQTPSPAAWPTFFETVCDRATRRCALRDAAELSRLALDTSLPAAAIADAARRLADAHAAASSADKLTLRAPDELLGMTFDDSDRILGDRLLAKGQSLVIAGAGSIGKSRLLLQLAVATIIGRQFLGFETRGESLRWLVLQAENSNRRLQADLAVLREWTGPATWARVNQQLSIHTLESDADGFLSLDNPNAQRRIADAVRDTQPDIVCFDSLYNFGIGDLNKDEDMGATLLAISRLTKAGNPNRCPVVLHHALTGKTGAAKATGYDRASFGRNSKVLHSWTRGQMNVAPGSPDDNETLVMSCGKCSNGREFEPFAARLNPQTMLYEVAPDFDMEAWQGELSGKASNAESISHERVAELCRGSMSKPELAKAIMRDCGCARGTAYRRMEATEKARLIQWSRATETYAAR